MSFVDGILYMRADFVKTNLTKRNLKPFEKKRAKRQGFLRLISSKITPAKEKEGERARSEDLKRNQEKRIMQWVALKVLFSFTLVYLTVNVLSYILVGCP